MKRKMLGAASVAMTAAALTMPATAPAQITDAVDINSNTCLTSGGVFGCAIILVEFARATGAAAEDTACRIVFGPTYC